MQADYKIENMEEKKNEGKKSANDGTTISHMVKNLCKLLYLWVIIVLSACGSLNRYSDCNCISNQFDTSVVIRYDTVVSGYYFAPCKWSNEVGLTKEYLSENHNRLVTYTRYHYEINGEESDSIYGCSISASRIDSIFEQNRLIMTIYYGTNSLKDTTFLFDDHEIKVHVNTNRQDWNPGTIVEYSYNSNGSRPSKEVKKHAINDHWETADIKKFRYNRKSQLISEKNVYERSNSKVREKRKYLYNKSGNLIHTKYRILDEDDMTKGQVRYEYDYDAAGRITGESTLYSNTVSSTVVYEYDSAGRKTKEIRMSEDTVRSIETFMYDNCGQLVVEKYYYNIIDNRPVPDDYHRTAYTYDETGRLKEKTEESFENGVISFCNSKTTYKYNEITGSVSIEENIQLDNGEKQTSFRYHSSVSYPN